MTSSRFGDVVLVPFPFADQSTSEKRRAVVVSSELFHRNRERSSVTVMAISSQSRPASETEAGVHHWQRAGLLNPSVIKPVIATLDVSLVIRKLGHLSDDDRTTLNRLLAAVLGHGGSAELAPEQR